MWRGREHLDNGNNNDKDDLFFKSNAIDSLIDADVTQSNKPKQEVLQKLLLFVIHLSDITEFVLEN